MRSARFTSSKRVYVNLIVAGQMTEHKARSEIAKLQAIAEHFAELAKGERLL